MFHHSQGSFTVNFIAQICMKMIKGKCWGKNVSLVSNFGLLGHIEFIIYAQDASVRVQKEDVLYTYLLN